MTGWGEPMVGLFNRGVLVAGSATRQGVAAGLARREKAKRRRNGLKRLNQRREMVWPRQPWTPNIWSRRRAATIIPKNSLRSRRMARPTSEAHGAAARRKFFCMDCS